MERIAESELIINSDGSVFHLHLKPEELAETVILVGDQDRARLVSQEYFETTEFLTQSREFVSSTGTYKGKRMTVLSTGIGCDNIDIVLNELDALVNIDFSTRQVKSEKKSLTILRLGTCGAVQPDIPIGSIIFSHISIGCDGLLNWYGDRNEIALVDFEEAFIKHVGWDKYLPIPYFVRAGDKLSKLFSDSTIKGMTISASGFYGPQGRVLRVPLAMPNMIDSFESFRHEGWRITNFEMEGSAIAGLAAKLGHEAATVCVAIANRHLEKSKPNYKEYVDKMIKLSLDKLAE